MKVFINNGRGAAYKTIVVAAHSEEEAFGLTVRKVGNEAVYSSPLEGWCELRNVDAQVEVPCVLYPDENNEQRYIQ